MKHKIFFNQCIFAAVICSISLCAHAQGKYAGSLTSILDTKYSSEQDIPALKGFSYRTGSVIGDVNDGPYFLSIETLVKGKVAVIILNKLVDIKNKRRSIIDLIELTNFTQGLEVRTSGCNAKPDETIVAIVNPGRKKYVKSIKQAYLLKDIRFEALDAQSVKKMRCVNEGLE